MLNAPDLVIIGIYFAIVLSIGLWFAVRRQSGVEFFLAGRNLTWPFIGLSLFATNISTEHFVGLASAGHSIGLVQGGYEWIASYCLIMLAAVFAPQYLRHQVYTIPEYFEKRYGVEARVGLTVYFLAMIVLTKVSVAVFSGGKVISHLSGWDLETVMWGIGIATAVYTLFGGLAAVVYTDAIQAVILIGGSILMTALALGQVGGWSGLEERLAALGRSDLLSMVRGPDDPHLPFSGFLLGNFLIGGMFYWCMDQVNVQRVLGARSIRHGRSGAIFAGFLKIIPVFILVLPGVIAVPLLPEIGDDHNATYAALVTRLLGPGLKGLVLAALLAALMSSLSSTFNSAATLVARDLVARFRPATSQRAQIIAGQGALIAVMVAGISCAPFIEKYETIWDYLQEVTGYLSVPFAVVGLSGIFLRRANRAGAMAAIAVGIAAGAFLYADSLIERRDLLLWTRAHAAPAAFAAAPAEHIGRWERDYVKRFGLTMDAAPEGAARPPLEVFSMQAGFEESRNAEIVDAIARDLARSRASAAAWLEAEGAEVRFRLLRHPYLASFLHRTFIAALLSFTALVAVSRLTAPPPQAVLDGEFSLARRPGEPEEPPRTLLHDHRLWIAVLFAAVTALWIVFR